MRNFGVIRLAALRILTRPDHESALDHLQKLADLAPSILTLCAEHEALLEYFRASTAYTNTVGHEDATLIDESKAEERFDRATQAAHRLVDEDR